MSNDWFRPMKVDWTSEWRRNCLPFRNIGVPQKLVTLPEHLSSLPVFSRVRVAQSLVFCVMFCDHCFVILYLFFRPLYCLSSPSKIYNFLLPLLCILNHFLNEIRYINIITNGGNFLIWDNYTHSFYRN